MESHRVKAKFIGGDSTTLANPPVNTATALNTEVTPVPYLLGTDLSGVAPGSPAKKSGKPEVPASRSLESEWTEEGTKDGSAGGQENPGTLQDPPPNPSEKTNHQA